MNRHDIIEYILQDYRIFIDAMAMARTPASRGLTIGILIGRVYTYHTEAMKLGDRDLANKCWKIATGAHELFAPGSTVAGRAAA